MRSVLAVVMLFVVLFHVHGVSGKEIWSRVSDQKAAKGAPLVATDKYLVFATDENMLKTQLLDIPADYVPGSVIELPMGDGTLRSFKVKHSSLIPATLAAKYPGLNTFDAVAIDNPEVTAKLDMTLYGFHAMVFDGEQTSFVNPYDNTNSGYYTVHYKKDELITSAERAACLVKTNANGEEEQLVKLARKGAHKTVNGTQLRTYRMALACNSSYSRAATGLANPSIGQVLSKMTTSMNRINGVYERELSVTMTFVANEDTLIWTTESGGVNGADPYTINDAIACNPINQATCDARIGTVNYDVGHVFLTGDGGYSQVGAVCQSTTKAQSATGRAVPVGDDFDIDYVVHEIGHEFGANHPFNDGSNGSCGNHNRYQPTSYEPGSGSTIMAYAGICSGDNIQPHSDDYFHAISLVEIQSYLAGAHGGACGVKTAQSNTPVTLPAFTMAYNIPYFTPFELTAPVVSSADTSITYCWEQWNLGIDDADDLGTTLKNTHDIGPIFRSYHPVKSPTRVFPRIDMVLSSVLSDVGNDNAQGEKAPDVARYMTFRLTVRNLTNGYGTFVIPDDSILLNVVNTEQGFKVTSQTGTGNMFNGGSTQNVTWNVVKTDQFPINAANVDIYMSADGGYTWPYHIGRYINNGSANVTLPNPDTTISNARIKVKGADNVFFNVNSQPFTVIHGEVGDTDIMIRPVPVHNTLRVSSGNKGLLQTAVFNAIGQEIWKGQVNGELDLPVTFWARGIYIIRFIDVKNKRTVKKFVVE